MMPDKPSILDTLRQSDRHAYLAALFAPADKRHAIASLWAFNAEIERIPLLVSEPMPGEIRLQWWRDVCDGLRNDEGQQHPVGAALIEAISEFSLEKAVFDRLCEARIFDLYNDPMPTKADFEGYLGETRSVLFQLSAQILGDQTPAKGDAAGHAGIAYGIAQLLQSLAQHRVRGQIFIPRDLMAIIGLSPEQFLALDDPSAANPIVELMVSLGREHLSKAEAAIAEMPQAQPAAFVLLGICAPLFKRAQKRGGAIAFERFSISPFTAQWYMTRYSLTL